MKFPAAPESTSEAQPASEMGPRKGLVENDDDDVILTTTLGDGRSQGRPSALVDPGVGHTVQAAIGTEPQLSLPRKGMCPLPLWVQALPQHNHRREVSGEVGTGAPEECYSDGWPSR